MRGRFQLLRPCSIACREGHPRTLVCEWDPAHTPPHLRVCTLNALDFNSLHVHEGWGEKRVGSAVSHSTYRVVSHSTNNMAISRSRVVTS